MSDAYDIKPGEWPAFPESGLSASISGFTKRELGAFMCLQGMLANNDGINRLWTHSLEQVGPNFDERTANVTQHLVERANELADTLLAELEKKK